MKQRKGDFERGGMFNFFLFTTFLTLSSVSETLIIIEAIYLLVIIKAIYFCQLYTHVKFKSGLSKSWNLGFRILDFVQEKFKSFL